MDVIETLVRRNEAFAQTGAASGLKIIPSMRLLVVGCVDPRVDPFDVLGLETGEAAVIRNVGGRITPDVLATLTMLQVVAKAGGGALGSGWNLVVLHHNDCGIRALVKTPDLLATFFGVSTAELDDLAISDPHRSVAIDVAALRSNPNLPGGFLLTGLFYDVNTGQIEVVVPTAPLRPEST